MDAIRLLAVSLQETDRSYEIAPHVHAVAQWYCVLSGSVRSVVDGTTFVLGPHDAMLVKPGSVRDRRCQGRAPTYMYAMFRNSGLSLDSLYNRKFTIPPELRPDVQALAGEIRTPGVTDSSTLTETLLVRILIGLARHADSGKAHTRLSGQNIPKQDELVARIEAYMQNHLAFRISRQDMAQIVHLCPTHLARIFRARTGKTLVERLTELRVERARRLLQESTLPITAIGYEVGFNSFSHFTKLFRRQVGGSPSDFRRGGVQFIRKEQDSEG